MARLPFELTRGPIPGDRVSGTAYGTAFTGVVTGINAIQFRDHATIQTDDGREVSVRDRHALTVVARTGAPIRKDGWWWRLDCKEAS